MRTIENGIQRRIWVNGTPIATINVPRTATAWTQNSWAYVSVPVTAALRQGANYIEVEYIGAGYVHYVDLDSLTVVRS